MKRQIKVALFRLSIPEFGDFLRASLKEFVIHEFGTSPESPNIESQSFDSRFELHFLPRRIMDDYFSVLEKYPLDRSIIFDVLHNLRPLDPDQDFDIYARNALPVLKWMNRNLDRLEEIFQMAFSGNPYIFRQLHAYTLVSRQNGDYCGGIEAYQLSYPLTDILVQFIDGYDPTTFKFYQPIGSFFDDFVDFITDKAKSPILFERVHQSPEPPGRPLLPDYDWAFEQIESGRDKSEVYLEWLKLKQEQHEYLADPQESFNKAMRLRKRRKVGDLKD